MSVIDDLINWFNGLNLNDQQKQTVNNSYVLYNLAIQDLNSKIYEEKRKLNNKDNKKIAELEARRKGLQKALNDPKTIIKKWLNL